MMKGGKEGGLKRGRGRKRRMGSGWSDDLSFQLLGGKALGKFSPLRFMLDQAKCSRGRLALVSLASA